MSLLCIAAKAKTPESWYATAPSVSHCGAGRWTCFPCAFIPEGSSSAGVQCTRSDVHIQLRPACNTHLWAKPCRAVHCSCTLTPGPLFFPHQVNISVASDLYQLQGMPLGPGGIKVSTNTCLNSVKCSNCHDFRTSPGQMTLETRTEPADLPAANRDMIPIHWNTCSTF